MTKLYGLQDEDTDTISIHSILEAVQSSLQGVSQAHMKVKMNSVWLQTDLLSLEGFHSSAVREWLDKYRGKKMDNNYSILCYFEIFVIQAGIYLAFCREGDSVIV